MGSTTRTLVVGALAGAGVAWGARQVLRLTRRIALDDRVVLITGASTGHGLVAARQAAAQGARLVIAARDAETLDAAAADLAQTGRGDVLAVPTDVSDPNQCAHLVAQAIARHGRLDVLVNNAGIIQFGPMETMTLEDYRAAMAANFWGAVHCTLAALPHFKGRGFGRIANVVSVGGLVATPHLLPYVASKFALAGFTRGLRTELAKDGILVTGVYPGLMRTGGHTHAWMKGDKEKQYALFAAGDTIPGLATSAEHVARALWRAVCDGDAEVHIGWQTWLGARLEALAPNWTAEALALMTRALPGPEGHDTSAAQGQQLGGTVPEFFNRQVPPATRPTG